MFDYEKFVGPFTITVPLVHFMACGIYMAGYSAGFGGNIGGMFSASDFFTITIQYLIATYVFGLGLPVLLTVVRHRLGLNAADIIDQEKNGEVRDGLIFVRNRAIKIITWGLPILAIFPLVALVLQIWTGASREYFLTFNFVILALMPMWWKLADQLNLEGMPVELAWLAVAFVVSVFGLGMNSGDRDRRLPYKNIASSRMNCGNHVILRPIGERFISVTLDNMRHLVDDECRVQFDFVPTKVILGDSLFDLVRDRIDIQLKREN